MNFGLGQTGNVAPQGLNYGLGGQAGGSVIASSQPGAILMVFSPINHGIQVVRPNVYKFDDNMVDVLTSGNSLGSTINNINRNRNLLAGAIMPDRFGMQMNTYQLNNLYSFILIVNHQMGVQSELNFGNTSYKSVHTGYFMDEPIAPLTWNTGAPITNPKCHMMFTHSNAYGHNLQQNFSQNGANAFNSVMANDDVVPQVADVYVDEPLELCDIGSITMASQMDPYSKESVSTGKSNKLSQQSNAAPIINDRVKSPRSQLIELATCVDNARTIASVEEDYSGGLERGLIGTDPNEAFTDNLYLSLNRPQANEIQNGINPAVGMSIEQLDHMFGGTVDVRPYQIPYDPHYEVRDQTNTDNTTVFSSLVSNISSAAAASCGILCCMIGYSSHRGLGDATAQGWAIDPEMGVTLVTPNPTQKQLDDAVTMFTRHLELSLFPVLLQATQAFQMVIDIDVTGSTNIQLKMDGFGAESGGFYTAHNKMGGMTSPALGTANTANNNKAQFEYIVDKICDRSFGGRQGMVEQQPVQPSGVINFF